MWDGETRKPRDRFTAFMKELAPGAHAFAQRMRKGKGELEADAQVREEAMERIRAFRAYARKRGEAFAERAVQRVAARPPDWDAIAVRKRQAAERDRAAHAQRLEAHAQPAPPEPPPPPPPSPPDAQASLPAPQQVEDGWVGGLAEAPPETPQGWKPIEWLNSKQYREMLKAPGAAGDRLRAQVANVMDRAMERGATARDAAMEAEMVATDAAACDREDARVQAKRDKKAKRRARKAKEEQAAKRELAERRKAREEEEEKEAELTKWEAEAARFDARIEELQEEARLEAAAVRSGWGARPGSSSQHAEETDPQDDEFCDDMERALQLSAEEATYREVQAVLAEDAAPVAPAPAPQPERAAAECAVCWEAATHLVSPCGHFCLCEACSQGMDKCPICRGGVQSLIKVFVS
jgi:hypothetical protein